MLPKAHGALVALAVLLILSGLFLVEVPSSQVQNLTNWKLAGLIIGGNVENTVDVRLNLFSPSNDQLSGSTVCRPSGPVCYPDYLGQSDPWLVNDIGAWSIGTVFSFTGTVIDRSDNTPITGASVQINYFYAPWLQNPKVYNAASATTDAVYGRFSGTFTIPNDAADKKIIMYAELDAGGLASESIHYLASVTPFPVGYTVYLNGQRVMDNGHNILGAVTLTSPVTTTVVASTYTGDIWLHIRLYPQSPPLPTNEIQNYPKKLTQNAHNYTIQDTYDQNRYEFVVSTDSNNPFLTPASTLRLTIIWRSTADLSKPLPSLDMTKLFGWVLIVTGTVVLAGIMFQRAKLGKVAKS